MSEVRINRIIDRFDKRVSAGRSPEESFKKLLNEQHISFEEQPDGMIYVMTGEEEGVLVRVLSRGRFTKQTS